jgi:hypothetical protein
MNPTREQQMSLTLREAINFHDDWRADDEGTVMQLLKKFQESGQGFRFDKPEFIKPHIERLPWKIEMQRALKAAWRSADYAHSVGLEGQVIQAVRAQGGHVDIGNPNVWTSMINLIGRQENWPLNQTGHEKKVDAAVEIIKRHITQGKTVFPRFLPNFGQVKYIPASELDSLSHEELVALDGEVSELRRQMGLLPEDYKAEHRGRGPQKTDQDISIRYSERAGARYERADDQTSVPLPGKMNRAAGLASPAIAWNPATRAEYKRAELLAVARATTDASREEWRRLIRESSIRVNEILGSK